MNLVPRSGGNRFAGQAFYQHRRRLVARRQPRRRLRALRRPIDDRPGIISAYDASGSLGGPIKRDHLVLRQPIASCDTAGASRGSS